LANTVISEHFLLTQHKLDGRWPSSRKCVDEQSPERRRANGAERYVDFSASGVLGVLPTRGAVEGRPPKRA
jgi:hypothetical protein